MYDHVCTARDHDIDTTEVPKMCTQDLSVETINNNNNNSYLYLMKKKNLCA